MHDRMSESWLDRAVRRLVRERREKTMGVQYYADNFKLVPGVTRSEEEVQAKAEELFGPAENHFLTPH